ncbi:MAG: hypothetical protein MUP55_03055 [Candidatus Aenigmarchaeota archaeon]|nr:hypothetical protein [Candidatus Aenigmarchaeota archaeon]
MNLFALGVHGQQTNCSLKDFIDYWKDKYYWYTTVSDSIYYYARDSLKENRDIEKAIALVGAWKTNSISLNSKSGNLAFICPCGAKYYFTDMWKTGTSSAYDVWMSLPDKLYEHKKRLTDPERLIIELSRLEYNGARSSSTEFGLIYSITYLHFLDSDSFPILDKFVYNAIEFIFSLSKPHIPFEPKHLTTFKDYEKLSYYRRKFMPKFNQLKKDSDSTVREIDKVLWAFGHFISGSLVPKSIKVCCKR